MSTSKVSLSLNPEGVEESTTQIQDAEEYRKEIQARIKDGRSELESKIAAKKQCVSDTTRWKTRRTQATKKGKTTINPPKPPLHPIPVMSQKANEYYDTDEVDVVLE